MIYLGNNIHLPLSPENNLNPGNEYFPPNNEQNLNDVYYQMETDRINKDFNDSEENNCISHEKPFIEPNDIFFPEDITNKEEKIGQENENIRKEGITERDINSNALQKHQNLDYIHIKTTTSQYDTINNKKIIIKNDLINKKFEEKFPKEEFVMDDFKEMQFLRKKNDRRTFAEIEKTKQSFDPGPKQKKKIGRHKKNSKEVYPTEEKIHGKDGDDNIIRKLNTFYLESIRNWLNKSFVDEKLNFLEEEKNKKKMQNYFIKLEPKIINNNLKKEVRIEILDKTFRNIFYSHSISKLFKKDKESSNKDLIEKIYNENNQPFVMYILGLTFYEGLNYFNGQITDEGVIEYFKKKYNFDEEIILKFISHFEKFDKFFDKIFEENEGGDKNDLFKYLAETSILSLNYKESFLDKSERKENKKNKNDKSDSD